MKNILVLLLFSLLPRPSLEQTDSLNIAQSQTSLSESSSLNDKIQTYLLSKKEFNGNVLIGKGNHIIFENSYGYADAEKTIPLQGNSKFNVGSIAKAFPALAILHLAEKGKLRFDQKLSDFIDGLPPWSQEVTIENLLFYKSGLPPTPYQKENTDDSIMQQIRNIEQLQFAPGTKTLYENLNNFLQTKIVEKVTRRTFKDYIKKLCFKKAKMSQATYFNFPPNNVIDENLAFAYSDYFGDDIQNNPLVKKFNFNYGMLYLTCNDLFQWSRWVLKLYNSNSPIHKVFFQEADFETTMGPMGVIKLNNGKVKTWEASGMAYSFLNFMMVDLEKDICIVIMTNRAWPNQLKYLNEMKADLLQLVSKN